MFETGAAPWPPGLVRGPVPLEKLRMPLCLAFGALLHAMTAKQVGIPGRSPTKWALK